MSELPPRHGTIRATLAEAVANGQLSTVKFLIEESGCDIDAAGADGTTALCAASLWGDDNMVKYLLSHGANVNAQNTATLWTPLHAAAFQEHGKVIRTLMAAGADPLVEDAKGRTPQDFATISEAIWPFFQAAGCVRTPKSELVAKGIIKRAEPSPTSSGVVISPTADASSYGLPSSAISTLSRPGSAYIRVNIDPMRPPTAVDRSGRAVVGTEVSPGSSGVIGGHVDPLEYSQFKATPGVGAGGIAARTSTSTSTSTGMAKDPSLSSLHL